MRFRHFLLFAALSAVSVSIYVALAALGGQAGFPLDDAWIHQTYARNFAESGQLAYVPGEPSAGSTSPLWTLLIVTGYKVNLDYRLWTYLLGALSLALCAWFVARLSQRLWPDRHGLAFAVGVTCVFEWHLAWAAASGMETTLFAALSLAAIDRAFAADQIGLRDGLIFGGLGGLLTSTRPEGLLVLVLAGSARIARPAVTARVQFVLAAIGAFVVITFPAAWLNWQGSGTPFPNTFYAKQQEYAIYFSSLSTWLPRALDVVGAPFVGGQVLLVPGLLFESVSLLRTLRDRACWVRMLPFVWIGLHLTVYATRLPVTYPHGRYLMPIVPAIVLLGLHGTWRLATSHRKMPRSQLAWRVGVGSLIGAMVAFWIVGAGAYRVDVDIIEKELVASARWTALNTSPEDLIAAHDIGAMGYFSRRPLLDLAGLISPEVIPIMRDEEALLELLRRRRAAYFAAPPDFYARLTSVPEFERVFAGNSPFTRNHWQIYRTGW